MMTVERFHEVLDSLAEVGDVSVSHCTDYTDLTFEDFEGFDDDWSEVFRDYAEPELVEELEDFIEEVAEGDFYQRFEFDGVTYQVGYGSFDI
jgi:hypothetical protein